MNKTTSEEPGPELFARVVHARAGGAVRRCHGTRQHGTYTCAEHQWGVAVLMWYLWPEHAGRLVPYCLFHDVPELWVGDIPSPVLRYLPGIREQVSRLEVALMKRLRLPEVGELSREDRERVSACDRLELYMWCVEQRLLGNQFAADFQRQLDRVFSEKPLPPEAARFYESARSCLAVPTTLGTIKELAAELFGESRP